MRIAPGEKFACYAFTRCWLADGMPPEIELRPRLCGATSLDFDVEEHWQAWLGSITMDELREANLVIYTTMASSRPEILDEENAGLAKSLDYVLFGLVLQGIPLHYRGYSMNGANVAGEINVRQFSNLSRYESTYEIPEFRPGAKELRRAEALAVRLRRVNEGGADWARLRRGVNALLRGSRMDDGTERLHQFVRALEALIKPDIGNTKRQFAHRIDQTFTVANDETRETLNQIFDLRSRIEHVHDPLDVLDGDRDVRIATANRRTRQVDVLARFAVTRVLEDDALFDTFRTEPGIEAFWARPDALRAAAWGRRLDLRTIG
jgi:hypothetical protein